MAPDKTQLMGRLPAYELYQKQSSITVGTSAVAVVQPNPRRIALMLQAISGGDVAIGFHPQVTVATGFSLVLGNDPVIISDDSLPGMAQRGFYAISGTAGYIISVVEIGYI